MDIDFHVVENFITMQSDYDMSGGAQTVHMLQSFLIRWTNKSPEMERTMAMQLDQFKQELHGATSSVFKEIENWSLKNSDNRDQYKHNEKVSDISTQALWALSNEKYDYCK